MSRPGSSGAARGEHRLGAARVMVDGRLEPGDPILADGRIVAIDAPRPNAVGIASPGFVDLQVNGITDEALATSGGPDSIDFCCADAASILAAAGRLAVHGVTAFCPTLITAPLDRLVAALGSIAGARRTQAEDGVVGGARVLGAHLEGPFLSPEKLGAHSGLHRLDPDPATIREVIDRFTAAGPVELMTIAPELPGAAALIEALHGHRIAIAAGHSDADAAAATAAFAMGVSLTTHHGNAMRAFAPRDPGLFGTALTDPRVAIPIIVDGHHLAPETVRLIARAAGDRLVLVSDAVARSGTLGGEKTLRLVDGAVRDEAGRLAGSALWLDEAVRNLVDLGVAPGRALAAASTTPARCLGLGGQGLIAGAPADLVLLDDELAVERVVIGGVPIA